MKNSLRITIRQLRRRGRLNSWELDYWNYLA
jgi:hypothetical protein